MSYSLTGDTPSPGYFTVDGNGRVTLITPLAGVQQDYFVVSRLAPSINIMLFLIKSAG